MLLKLLKNLKENFKASRLIFKNPENFNEEEKEIRLALKQAREANKEKEVKALETRLQALKERKKSEKESVKEMLTPSTANAQEAVGESLFENPDTKNYLKSFEKLPSGEELSNHLKVADHASMIDLQGGYYLSKLKNPDNLDIYQRRAQVYLKKTENGFKVQNLRDNTKYVIGAAHVIPPSYTKVSIVDTQGNKRTGIRQERNGVYGYFDAKGYMEIYNNYLIIPEETISEQSDLYEKQVTEETEFFKNIKEQAQDYQNIEYNDETGGENSRIRSLSSLEESVPESKETEKVKSDWEIMKSIFAFYGIKLHTRNEIDGGRVVLNLSRSSLSGPEMLGFTKKMQEKLIKGEANLNEILKKDLKPNNLINFLRAIEKTENFEFLGKMYHFNISETYHLKLYHLRTFHRLTELYPQKFKKILRELESSSDPISVNALIDKLFAPKTSNIKKSKIFERTSTDCMNSNSCFQYEDYRDKNDESRNYAVMSKRSLMDYKNLRINPFRKTETRIDRKIKKNPSSKRSRLAIRQAREISEKIPPEKLAALHKRIQGLDPAQKIIETAVTFMEYKVKGYHCYSWAMAVYEFAVGYYSKHTIFRYSKGTRFDDTRGNASPDLLKKGDWIYTHAPGNKKFNHSTIVMGVQNKGRYSLVQTISYPNYNNNPPRIVTIKVTNNPSLLQPGSKYRSVKKISRVA
ncbi:hypothetical protein GF354_02435 [Candidatus Peregrinibacteria bacterium]|nr:hypothetical protein [Candidatus Peregrinibacteria bacterium]